MPGDVADYHKPRSDEQYNEMRPPESPAERGSAKDDHCGTTYQIVNRAGHNGFSGPKDPRAHNQPKTKKYFHDPGPHNLFS
jgi:hypothetical protein